VPSYIFYVADKPGQDRQPINLPGTTQQAFIRVEAASAGADDLTALDEAKLLPGEIGVMNTHTIPWVD